MREKLHSIDQEAILKYTEELDSIEFRKLSEQVMKLSAITFQQQRALLSPCPPTAPSLQPFSHFQTAGNSQYITAGKNALKSGKVGCLVVAGGQASRLRLNGPKGAVAVSPIKGKSLFQLFAEKGIAASHCYGKTLPLAFMTSPQNHQETVDFFHKHQNFNLTDKQLHFFTQSTLPLLNDQGDLFLETTSKIAEGPDGNGHALKQFVQSGIWQKWWDKGIRFLNFILVDNPLSDPFDAELVGLCHSTNSDIVVQTIKRKSGKEKVGVLVVNEGKTEVVEYSELRADEQHAKFPNGELKHSCANIGTFCFSMQFVKQMADEELPLHLARKAVKYLTDEKQTELSSQPNAWKFETFIFDILPFAKKIEALLTPREHCFAPLKNVSGENSLEDVQKLLQQRDREILENITGQKLLEESPIELPQEFHYPTAALIDQWQAAERLIGES